MTGRAHLVALVGDAPHSWIMVNALRRRFGEFPVIVEAGESDATFWARRKRLLGARTVLSMKLARIPLKLTKFGTSRLITNLTHDEGLDYLPPTTGPLSHVPSVNHQDVRKLLSDYAPKVVFVCSTRMIGAKTLSAVDAPFINYHSGINPAYRGMFGGYFALANGEPQHFGATVHLVDDGVDTGDVLYQSRVDVKKGDNFHTYLWRIAAGSRDIVVQAVEDALAEKLRPYAVDLPSKQYFAPTLGGYLWTGVTKGVW